MKMLVPFIHNVIDCIDNVINGILLHVNIWFDVESVNLLLLLYPQPNGYK
jgi:hypothetical protein